MPKPHSFYRFQPAWNAGFYPDNQITSNILNDLYIYITGWIATSYSGKTIGQYKADVKALVETYNVLPYFGNLEVIATTAPDPPFVDYYIYIRNADLYTIDNNQQLLITGQYNASTLQVINATVTPFTPGSYTGTFDKAAIPVEADVANALTIVNQYGSAFFPMTYSYNSTTGIAKSGLARGTDWELDANNNPVRLPANTLPLMNARRFNLEALNANDKFIISVMDRVIASSLADPDYVSIHDDLDSFTMPDGWTATWNYDATTYERIQIDFEDSDNLKVFSLVGRLDGDWLWQRFVKEDSAVADSFMSAYLPTTPLPYVPTSSSSYLYFGAYYDYEFVDFTSDCYVSTEFYAMPAIPGDQWQFNVDIEQGNLIGLDTAQVGLFQEDGGFIQNIGSAYLATGCFSQMYASVTIPAVPTGCYRLGMYQPPTSTCEFEFYYLVAADSYLASINAAPLNYLCFGLYNSTSSEFVVNYGIEIPAEGLTGDDVATFANTIPGMVAVYNSEFNYFAFTWTKTVDCNASYTMRSYIGDVDLSILDGLWSSTEQECVCGTQYYLYSLSNIINVDASDCFSTMLEFWSDNNSISEGFEYITDWKQKVRLGINGGGAKPIIEENLYRQSNGVHKRPQNKQDLSVDLHTDFLDEETQLALVDATRHPYLVWNQKPIFVKGDIEVATTQDFTTQSSFETLAQVKFQALIQGFQPKNSSCLTC